MKNAIISVLFISFAAFSQPDSRILNFGLFLQGYDGIVLEDIYLKCLTNSINHFEVGANFNQPFVPGNYLWASIDSTVNSAYTAGLIAGQTPNLCLSVSKVEMPGWCWAIEYGQIGSSDPKDFSIYENHDLFSQFYGLLAERYMVGGLLSQREGWGTWGVNRYNTYGESDLSWHPSGYTPFGDPPYYKIQPAQMRIPALVATFKETRQEIHNFDASAEVALSFMCQPYQESWPYDTYWPTGLGVGEFETYMSLLYKEFDCQAGYNEYPSLIDWHAYPHFNDPLRFGKDGLWVESLPDDYCWWFEDVSLSERAAQHDKILDNFNYDDCQLVVFESGASPFWFEIKPEYQQGENIVNGHISLLLSTLAEMSANNRTTLLQFDTDIDEVTARYVPEGYTMRDWWNNSDEEIDKVFIAYSRMVGLLTGKYFFEKQEFPVLGLPSTQTVVVHSFYDPETTNFVHQIRTSLPTMPSENYRVQIPVSTRLVTIIPSIGDSYSYDCGPFVPYNVLLDVGWTPIWIEEEISQPRSITTEAPSLTLSLESGNPITEDAVFIQVETSAGATSSYLSVFDLYGRIIRTISFQADNNGLAKCNLPIQNIPSGLYFLRGEFDDSNILRLTIIK